MSEGQREQDLYPPVKAYLERQGYDVKGEIGSCDVFAVRGDEPPLIVELKRTLNLEVLLQAVDRLAIAPHVYVGVPSASGVLKRRRKQVVALCRRLGIGLLLVSLDEPASSVQVLVDPGPYQPRVSKHRGARLLREFQHRVGDPNAGGTASRSGVVTAYRQRATKIAHYLSRSGPTKAAVVAQDLADPKARSILYRNVYGWFERAERGVYQLSPRGERET